MSDRRRPNGQDVADAQRMKAAGWNAQQIHRRLSRLGVQVAVTTVYRWTDDEYRQRMDATSARWAARRRAERNEGRLLLLSPGRYTPEFRIARIRGLAELGVSAASIAKVMRFDRVDDGLTERQVRYALETGRYDQRAPEEAAA